MAIVFLVIAFFIDCTRQSLALVTLAFFGLFAGSAVPGFFTSSCSFAPMYTGMVSSITEVAAAVANLLAPVLVGFIVKQVCFCRFTLLNSIVFVQGETHEWGYVFLTVAVINVVSGVVYAIFGTGKITKK